MMYSSLIGRLVRDPETHTFRAQPSGEARHNRVSSECVPRKTNHRNTSRLLAVSVLLNVADGHCSIIICCVGFFDCMYVKSSSRVPVHHNYHHRLSHLQTLRSSRQSSLALRESQRCDLSEINKNSMHHQEDKHGRRAIQK